MWNIWSTSWNPATFKAHCRLAAAYPAMCCAEGRFRLSQEQSLGADSLAIPANSLHSSHDIFKANEFVDEFGAQILVLLDGTTDSQGTVLGTERIVFVVGSKTIHVIIG
jgi:hypothetical protein